MSIKKRLAQKIAFALLKNKTSHSITFDLGQKKKERRKKGKKIKKSQKDKNKSEKSGINKKKAK